MYVLFIICITINILMYVHAEAAIFEKKKKQQATSQSQQNHNLHNSQSHSIRRSHHGCNCGFLSKDLLNQSLIPETKIYPPKWYCKITIFFLILAQKSPTY